MLGAANDKQGTTRYVRGGKRQARDGQIIQGWQATGQERRDVTGMGKDKPRTGEYVGDGKQQARVEEICQR